MEFDGSVAPPLTQDATAVAAFAPAPGASGDAALRSAAPSSRGGAPEGNATGRIMIVDDEPINTKVVRKYLQSAGYTEFVAVSEPTKVIRTIRQEQPDVLLMDVVMPLISGLDILQQIREDEQLGHLPVIILTASSDEETKRQALELGATDFLTRPVDPTDLIPRVRNAMVVKAHHDHLRHYADELAREVRLRTAELAASRLEVIHCLARAGEFRDNETGRHIVRVARYSGIIARRLGLAEELAELIEHAAPLHDIGKIGIPDAILLKPEKLTPEEYALMQKHTSLGMQTFEVCTASEWRNFQAHTVVGENLLAVRGSSVLQMAGRIALTHHEKWNGSGYPLGLAGEDIPIEGRIVAVADVFDALSSKRPYKPAFPLDECFAIMKQERGSHFDPRILDAFLACREEIVNTRIQYADLD